MIACIGLASGLGAGNSGCAEGPLFLKENLKINRLYWHKMITVESETENKYDLLHTLNRQLSEASRELCREKSFFLSFGGDHSCAIGALSGVAVEKKEEDLGLIWIDAHMDAHTPDTSDSGNIHGMPLAALLGAGDARLTGILSNKAKFKPENVVLIGVRSFEPKEALFLASLDVKIYFMEEVKKRGFKNILEEVLDNFSKRLSNYCVSFDLDAIDPTIIKAVGTPVADGIDPDEAIEAMEVFAKKPPLIFEMVEYNPKLDHDKKSFTFIQNLLKKLIGGLK